MNQSTTRTIAVAIIAIIIIAGAGYVVLNQDQTSKDKVIPDSDYYPLNITVPNNPMGTDQDSFMTFVITERPTRVVTNSASITDTFIALGLQNLIVAGTMGNNPEYKSIYDTLNLYTTEPDKETMIALQPDLIVSLSSNFSNYNASWAWGPMNEWNQRGCTCLPNDRIYDSEDWIEFFDNIGNIFRIQDSTQSYIDRFNNIIERTESISDKPSALIIENSGSSFRAYGEGCIQGLMVKYAGAENLVKEWYSMPNAETVQMMNPDIIFMIYFNDTEETTMNGLLNNAALASVTAIHEKKVLAISFTDFYQIGISQLDVMEKMYEYLYG